jgi:hypothetical protein
MIRFLPLAAVVLSFAGALLQQAEVQRQDFFVDSDPGIDIFVREKCCLPRDVPGLSANRSCCFTERAFLVWLPSIFPFPEARSLRILPTWT